MSPLLHKRPAVALTRILVFLLSMPLMLAQPGCRTQSSYNPIAEDYPLNITGMANGTFASIFVVREIAESLLPEGLGFLDAAYNREYELYRDGYIPLLVRALYVHDIRAPDDMWRPPYSLISFEFPFVDALHDGKTPFRYVYAQFIRTGTPNYAMDVARRYRVPHIVPSVFEPECDAYGPYPHALKGIPVDWRGQSVVVTAPMQVTREGRPFGRENMKNIVSSPRFNIGEDGQMFCGRTKVFWGTSVMEEETSGQVNVTGSFEFLHKLIKGGREMWDNQVYGIRTGSPFVDDDFVDCSSLAV
ncbi:hypothetical protein MFIFM68171_08230 [Madurella fahalii]|uniref:Uncharacterized protein n=1 Tax=Madurella fahalii TaxID=1157608 RepID=A0ABQ0GJS1_9PEZI